MPYKNTSLVIHQTALLTEFISIYIKVNNVYFAALY